jgi:hypothetical protein
MTNTAHNAALKANVKDALNTRAEDLFELVWGQPFKRGGHEWRPSATSPRAMEMRGRKRGLWHDHSAGQGGDLLDLIAVEFCGLDKARDDFPRVLKEAANWCGINQDAEIDLEPLKQRQRDREATAEIEEKAELAKKAATLDYITARAQPAENSPAALYLESRGITDLPDTGIAFLPPIGPTKGIAGGDMAACVVWATDSQGKPMGGQRILLNLDGSRTRDIDVSKPTFGSAGGYPARFAARVQGGPLCIAEGPESALSIWQATGFETWAVFGVSNWQSAPIPTGRKVILCPDRDLPEGTHPKGSDEARAKESAARAFNKAVQHHSALGCNLHIAQAPEPKGSKRDLNDTLQRAGLQSVRDAIAAATVYKFARYEPAPAPPFYPMPEGDRAKNIAAHGDTVRAFFGAHIPALRASHAVKELYTEIDELDPRKAALQKAARATVKREMGLDYMPSTLPRFSPDLLRVLLSGAQGVGKSAALVGDVQKARDSGRTGTRGALHDTRGIVSLVLAPDGTKTDELHSDYLANTTPDSPPAFRLMGRNQTDKATGETLCLIPKAADKIAKKGANVKKALCKKCPHSGSCKYLRNEEKLADIISAGEGVAIFAPQDYAFLPLPRNYSPHLVVMDEALRDDGALLHTIDLESLGEPLRAEGSGRATSIIGQTAEQADAAAANLRYIQPLRVAVRDGFRDAPTTPYIGFSARGIDPEYISQAIAALTLFQEHEIEYSIAEAVRQWQFGQIAGGNLGKSLESHLDEVLASKEDKQSRAVKALFEAVQKDLIKGHATPTAVVRKKNHKGEFQNSIAIADLRKPYFSDKTPLLNMDGTADPRMVQEIFGPMAVHNHSVERNAHTTQVTGHAFTIGQLTGTNKHGKPLNANSVKEAKQLRAYIAAVAERNPSPLIVASKRVRDAFISDGITTPTAHYKALRGRNDWEKCETVIIAGPEIPPPAAIEEKARSYAANDPTAAPFKSIGTGRWHKEVRALRMRNGTPQMIEVVCHPYPWAERILRQARDTEIMQAIDRVRLIYNAEPKNVIIMAPVVLDITVDEVVQWSDFKTGGSRIERAIAQSGVVPLSKRTAPLLHPDLWKADGTAQRDMALASDLVKSLLDQNPISISLIGKWSIKSARLCTYKAALKKGQKRAHSHDVLIWADTAEEARAKLESLTGPLQAFAEVEGWIAARDAAQDALDDWEERAARLEYSEGYTQQDAERIASGLPPVPPRPEIGPDVVPIPDAPTQEPAPVVPFRIETHYSDRPEQPPPRRTAGAVP